MKVVEHSSLRELLNVVSAEGAAVAKVRSGGSVAPIGRKPNCYMCGYTWAVVTVYISRNKTLHRWGSGHPSVRCSKKKFESLYGLNGDARRVWDLCELYGLSVSKGEWTEEGLRQLMGKEIS